MSEFGKSSILTPLKRVRGLGAAGSGTEHFWRQRLTALANLILVPAFLVILLATLGKDYAGVRSTLSHPLAAIVMILAILSITTHMRIGMQVIIEDYVHDHLQKVALLALNTFYAVAVALACIFAILKLSFGA